MLFNYHSKIEPLNFGRKFRKKFGKSSNYQQWLPISHSSLQHSRYMLSEYSDQTQNDRRCSSELKIIRNDCAYAHLGLVKRPIPRSYSISASKSTIITVRYLSPPQCAQQDWQSQLRRRSKGFRLFESKILQRVRLRNQRHFNFVQLLAIKFLFVYTAKFPSLKCLKNYYAKKTWCRNFKA